MLENNSVQYFVLNIYGVCSWNCVLWFYDGMIKSILVFLSRLYLEVFIANSYAVSPCLHIISCGAVLFCSCVSHSTSSASSLPSAWQQRLTHTWTHTHTHTHCRTVYWWVASIWTLCTSTFIKVRAGGHSGLWTMFTHLKSWQEEVHEFLI